MEINKNIQAFFALLQAGLWENSPVHDSWFMVHGPEQVDWGKVYRLASEQSIQGLVLQGIERFKVHDSRFTVPQEQLLQWIGEVQMIEQQNKAMNEFVAKLIEKLRNHDVYAILVKGQGIAQCYERPLWRVSGDVDLLLSEDNYEKAKKKLVPQALDVGIEYKSFKHLGMTMDGGIVVELHGTQHSRLSRRVDRMIDKAQKDIFYGGSVRSWLNGNTTVFLPSPDSDVIFVFTHILHHYFIDGIGLKQICDWCRLLWRYRAEIDVRLLEQRLQKAGLMSEWRAFAALAVEWLGMPVETMPLYSSDKKWSRKAERIIAFVLECGNFGHNRQTAVGKISSAWYKMRDFVRHTRVFPLDSVKFFFHFMIDGVKLALAK